MAVQHKPKQKTEQQPKSNGGATQLVPKNEKGNAMRGLLERSKDQLTKALAGSMSADQFIRIALTAYLTGHDLTEAEPITFLGACMQAAQLGLSVDPMVGEAYLVTRWNKHIGRKVVQLQIGYQGLMKRVRRSPLIDTIDADVVYENDHFEVVKGTDATIRHRPCLTGEPGEVVAAYAIARFKSGSYTFRVVPRWEIEQAKQRSDSAKKGQGPWVTDFGAMAMKTALRRLLKLLPTDAQTRAFVNEEEKVESDPDAIDVTSTMQIIQDAPKSLSDFADQHEQEGDECPEEGVDDAG